MAYSTIDKSSSLMNTLVYTGDGSATQAQTGLGFQPDFNWTKATTLSESNALTDSVRGATQTIYSNLTSADSAISSNLKSFDADGFTMGSNGEVGQNSIDYASWNWKGGTTSGLTGGTITPSAYSYNTTSKFGIYKYTGTGSNATIAHMLGTTPSVIMIKRLDGTDNWACYHSTLAATEVLMLDTTGTSQTMADRFNSTAPTSTLFSIGTAGAVNASGGTYIAYVWCDVKGFCKSGRYKGNGETTAGGTFIYTGFKPSFVLIKNTGATAAWNFNNNKWAGYNPTPNFNPNSAGAAGSYKSDIFSNGFKVGAWATADAELNASGNNYAYLAVGQSLIGSNGVCGTAR